MHGKLLYHLVPLVAARMRYAQAENPARLLISSWCSYFFKYNFHHVSGLSLCDHTYSQEVNPTSRPLPLIHQIRPMWQLPDSRFKRAPRTYNRQLPKGFRSRQYTCRYQFFCSITTRLDFGDEPEEMGDMWSCCEFPAASVVLTRELLRRSGGRGLTAVIANSGCANLLTGEEGLEDAKGMSREAGSMSVVERKMSRRRKRSW